MWKYHVELDATHPDLPMVTSFFHTCFGKTKREVRNEMADWMVELADSGYTIVSMTSQLTHMGNGKHQP